MRSICDHHATIWSHIVAFYWGFENLTLQILCDHRLFFRQWWRRFMRSICDHHKKTWSHRMRLNGVLGFRKVLCLLVLFRHSAVCYLQFCRMRRGRLCLTSLGF